MRGRLLCWLGYHAYRPTVWADWGPRLERLAASVGKAAPPARCARCGAPALWW